MIQTATEASASEPIRCEGCEHPIADDQPRLSDIPEHMPESLDLRAFRHFHTSCDSCDSAIPCYQLYMSRQTPFAAQARAECSSCDHPIRLGQDVFRDSFYVWNRDGGREGAGKVSGTFAAVNTPASEPASFGNLDPGMRLKFSRMGLGGRRGVRTPHGAEQMFRSKVPAPVRNMGREAVDGYVKGKVGSHIESVANAPGKAKSPGNIVLEPARRNLRRGSANMTRVDQWRAHTMNRMDAAKGVAKRSGGAVGKAAVLAAAMELPVSATVGAIRVAKGKISKKDAAKEACANTVKAGVVGGAFAVGLTGAAALGAAPVLAAVSPVMIPVGLAMYGVSSAQRIRDAVRDLQPLESVARYFHAGCVECGAARTCYELFAAEVSRPT